MATRTRESIDEDLREPQLTGFAPLATGRKVSPAKQVDPTQGRLELAWDRVKKRSHGREQSVIEALKAIRDLDPQAAQGVWNFLRLINPGHDLRAYVGAGDDEKAEGGEAQAYLDGLAHRVGGEYGGGLDQLHNVLSLSLITNGAVAAEAAPTADLKDVEDWYPVDPMMIAFQREKDSKRLVLGQQYRDGSFIELNPSTVFYTPLDPDVDDPYGRAPLLSAVAAVMAKAQLLVSVRSAAHHAGMPRIDVAIVAEEIFKAAPAQLTVQGQEKAYQAWCDRQLDRLTSDYLALQPDDVFVHWNWVTVGLVGGTTGSFDFEALIKVLERQVSQALKTLPILSGILDSTTESHGSVQWQIQVITVRALRRLVKRTIEKLAQASLDLAGFQAHPKVEYDDVRDVDRLNEAQSELFETRVLQEAVKMGWRSNDEASEIATGHKAFGEPIGLTDPAEPTAPGAADETQAPTNNEKASVKPKEAGDEAWDLLRSMDDGWIADRRRARLVLEGDLLEALSAAYAARAQAIFDQQLLAVLAALRADGRSVGRTTREIADSAFGLSYRRLMKRLLREAIADGLLRAGFDGPVPERLVRRIWKGNDQFISRLRDDLAAQIREWAAAPGPVSLEDVADWFSRNDYRERLMGQFLAKQGIASGFTHGRSQIAPAEVFLWRLGDAVKHCPDCLARNGQVYTHLQLVEIGMPGSLGTQCGSGCRCSIVVSECTSSQMARVFEDITQDQAAACSVAGSEARAKPAVGDEAHDVAEDRALDREARVALSDYRNWGYNKVNAALYGRDMTPEAKAEAIDLARRLDKAKHQVDRPIKVWRGFDWFELSGEKPPMLAPGLVSEERMRGMVGRTIRIDGFMSTSTSKSAAHRPEFGTDLMEIRLSPGVRATSVLRALGEGVGKTRGEAEILLGRGAVLRIDGFRLGPDLANIWQVTVLRMDPVAL